MTYIHSTGRRKHEPDPGVQQPREIAATEDHGNPVERRRPECEPGQQQVHVRKAGQRVHQPFAEHVADDDRHGPGSSARLASSDALVSPCLRPNRTKWTKTPRTPPSMAMFPSHLSGPFHNRTDIGIVGSRGRPYSSGPIAVGEDRDHRRSADAGRIVDRRLREPVRLELSDALAGDFEHRVLRPELQTARRTGLHARRLQANRHAIDAHRALVDATRLRRGTSGHRTGIRSCSSRSRCTDPAGSRRSRSCTARWRRAPDRRRGSPARRSACTGPCASASRTRHPSRAPGT